MRAELTGEAATLDEIADAASYPPVPTIQLVEDDAAHVLSPAAFALWNDAQAELAAALGAELRTVPGTDHYIQRSAPQAVVDAVADVLRARD